MLRDCPCSNKTREVLGNPSPTPERFPETRLEGQGMDFPIPPEFWWSTVILLIINLSTEMDRKIHPCGQGMIDSVKSNPSLLMMRDWVMYYVCCAGIIIINITIIIILIIMMILMIMIILEDSGMMHYARAVEAVLLPLHCAAEVVCCHHHHLYRQNHHHHHLYRQKHHHDIC